MRRRSRVLPSAVGDDRTGPPRFRSEQFASALAEKQGATDLSIYTPTSSQTSAREASPSTVEGVSFGGLPPPAAASETADADPHGHYEEDERRPSIFEATEEENQSDDPETAPRETGDSLLGNTYPGQDTVTVTSDRSLKDTITTSAAVALPEKTAEPQSWRDSTGTGGGGVASVGITAAGKVAETGHGTRVGHETQPVTSFTGPSRSLETDPNRVPGAFVTNVGREEANRKKTFRTPSEFSYVEPKTDDPMYSETLSLDAGFLKLDRQQKTAAVLLLVVCLIMVLFQAWKTRAWTTLFCRNIPRERDYEKVLREETPPASPYLKDFVVVQSTFTSPPRKNVPRSRRNSAQACVDSVPHLVAGGRRVSLSSLPCASTANVEITATEPGRPQLSHSNLFPLRATDETGSPARRNAGGQGRQPRRIWHRSAASVGSVFADFTKPETANSAAPADVKEGFRRKPAPFQLRAALGGLLPTVAASPTFAHGPGFPDDGAAPWTCEPVLHHLAAGPVDGNSHQPARSGVDPGENNLAGRGEQTIAESSSPKIRWKDGGWPEW